MKKLITLAVVALMCSALRAQPAPPTVSPTTARGTFRGGRGAALPAIKVTLDHEDWNYLPGETAKFTVTAPAGTQVRYTVGPEMMPAEAKTATIPQSGSLVLDGGTMKDPGFLRCSVTAQGFSRGLATAGFSPQKIKPTQTEPADFDAFWAKAKAELAALPLDAKLTPYSQNNPDLDAFEVNFQNIGTAPTATSRFYGILYIPHGDGPFPAMMCTPGAGVRGPDVDTTFGWATRGYIVLYVGIHDMPVIPVPGAAPSARPPGNYQLVGLENRDQYYFRRVLMGCVRANDYLVTLPKWGSQGGYLAITTTALDPRVTCCNVEFPAFCDVTGYLHGRAGGWPGFKFDDPGDPQRDAKIATTAYYDSVNFARRIKVPGHYGWGYNDDTCPPDSTFSMYNVVTAPKTLTIVKEMGHNRAPGFLEVQREWLAKQVGK
jgi:cephalosporin-C deacetylase-like acetyl esterase